MLQIIGAVVLIVAVWMPLHFWCERTGHPVWALVTKAAGTLTAASFAVWACFFGGRVSPYTVLMLAGLGVCTAADVWLDIRFKVGGALFFMGHVLYVAAFMNAGGNSLWALPFLLGVFVVLGLVLRRFDIGIPAELRVPLVLYAVVLSALCATGFTVLLARPSPRAVCGAIGAALFVLSDIFLLRNRVNKASTGAYFASLGVYYMGQLFLSLSAAILF